MPPKPKVTIQIKKLQSFIISSYDAEGADIRRLEVCMSFLGLCSMYSGSL